MSHAQSSTAAISRPIQYLSAPAQVSMADSWYDITSLDHFWIHRRFQVFRKLAGRLVPAAAAIAEIGCGHGLLQLQVERAYNREVVGFDLNEVALRQNVSQSSELCCYDIFQREPSLRARFDLIFLFDILEHIAEEERFLSAVRFHLSPNGRIIVNVPAGQWAYSAYDRAAGHLRRYSIGTLDAVAARNNLQVADWTYWGFTLLPMLVLRMLWLEERRDNDEIIRAGLHSRNQLVNASLKFLSACEWIPQKFFGTSLMVVLEPVPNPRQGL